MPCVFFLRIFCISYLFWPIHTVNLNAIKAMGKSDIFLKLEILKKIFEIFILMTTMWLGVKVMACGVLVCNVMGQIINSWPNRKLLNYKYSAQIKDVSISIILAFVMGVFVYFLGYIHLHVALKILVQLSVGVLIYVGGSALLKLEEFEYIV